MKPFFTALFGLIMVAGGTMHFVKPEFYMPFFPPTFPAKMMVYASGVVEILVGICAILPSYRAFGTFGILVLMLVFLPLHFIDIFNTPPVIGSLTVAYIRFFLQFVLIGWAWWIWKK